MLVTFILFVAISVVSSERDQPSGCPLPTGPYVQPECGENEYFEICSFKCPPQTCSSVCTQEPCDPGDGCCRNECRCIAEHYRDADGNCVPIDKCYRDCLKPVESDWEDGLDVPNLEQFCIATCAAPNPQNCQYNRLFTCRGGYVFTHKGGICIKIEYCPQFLGCNGDENAVIKSCPTRCPLTCDSTKATEICIERCLGMGCSCREDYVLTEKIGGKCVKEDQCPNATTRIPPKPDCIPTCAEPNPQNCEYNAIYKCEDGYVLSEKMGECIQIEDCPQDLGCNGDENAVIQSCPPPCPSTCNSPNEIPCRKACLAMGCACKYGYILNEEGGKCVEADQCPNGNPCGKNGTFVNCRVECPDVYCPMNDDRSIIACDPPYPCPSGCICKLGYSRTNTDDHQCILNEECPPVNCTRPNEVWCSCPSACLAEDCADVDNQPTTCNTLVHNCDPRCICDEGFFRNSTGICIPADDCPYETATEEE